MGVSGAAAAAAAAVWCGVLGRQRQHEGHSDGGVVSGAPLAHAEIGRQRPLLRHCCRCRCSLCSQVLSFFPPTASFLFALLLSFRRPQQLFLEPRVADSWHLRGDCVQQPGEWVPGGYVLGSGAWDARRRCSAARRAQGCLWLCSLTLFQKGQTPPPHGPLTHAGGIL